MRIVLHEDLNFLLTNRIPRTSLTRFMGWFSRIEQPLVRDALDRRLARCSPTSTGRGEEHALRAACTTASSAS